MAFSDGGSHSPNYHIKGRTFGLLTDLMGISPLQDVHLIYELAEENERENINKIVLRKAPTETCTEQPGVTICVNVDHYEEYTSTGLVWFLTKPADSAAMPEWMASSCSNVLHSKNTRLMTLSVGTGSYTRAFGDGPRNFEPWSSDEACMGEVHVKFVESSNVLLWSGPPDEIANLFRELFENESDGVKLFCSNLYSDDEDARLNKSDCEISEEMADEIENIPINPNLYVARDDTY
ncbi:hypothetical protein TNCV_273721 [Trichonephila clavipes]|nr:hypothetical protein TNCV_273721 [Trichonephila clavipes]